MDVDMSCFIECIHDGYSERYCREICDKEVIKIAEIEETKNHVSRLCRGGSVKVIIVEAKVSFGWPPCHTAERTAYDVIAVPKGSIGRVIAYGLSKEAVAELVRQLKEVKCVTDISTLGGRLEEVVGA